MASKTHHAPFARAFNAQYGVASDVIETAQAGEQALLTLLTQGNTSAALTLARDLTQRFAERGLGWKVLGALLWAEGRAAEALTAMQNSLRLLPRDAEAHSNLGLIMGVLERFDEAETCLLQALQIDPNFATAHYRLGMTYYMQARMPEAEASLRTGVSLRAGYATGDDELNYSNLLFISSHNPALDADALFAEHCRFGECFESGLRRSWPRHTNSRDPDRRLKVGFVSGDLRDHAVASYVEPLLAQLRNHAGLQLHAYHSSAAEDGVSRRLRALVHGWRPVAALPDPQLAQAIMDDGVDILIDLSGHTGLNRLPAFARKPAPIQASWIGYQGTTGLRAMDYYLADRHFLPPGEFDGYFTEKLVYLPGNAPFQPHDSAPPVNALPALATGRLTFGSFTRADKINDATIQLWSRLLLELPQTQMILGGIARGSLHTRLIERFAASGIARERLIFHPRRDMGAYLALHHQVDICLDTIPYCGGTTTYHALWMGVPTLTTTGATPASRQGAAIMGQMGLDGFVAANTDDFVALGLDWAKRLTALAAVRAGLRERWQHSPARRADVIGTAFDTALRHMWKLWCADLPAESFHASGAAVIRS
jgi:predicted O-linked N-acetylglucosamine transferase (SPINDLY family)